MIDFLACLGFWSCCAFFFYHSFPRWLDPFSLSFLSFLFFFFSPSFRLSFLFLTLHRDYYVAYISIYPRSGDLVGCFLRHSWTIVDFGTLASGFCLGLALEHDWRS